jgi:tetratricopeptide (TPR) repeat protein
LDAAFAAGGIEGALGFEPETVAGRWRRGALLLARASVPAFADPRFRGMQGVAERRQRAALSARLLAEVADESNEHRSDALARAVLGQVVAASADGADAAARDLVGLLGVERACAAFDSLELKAGEPALLDRLRKGYASVVDPDSREAGLKAALVLIPEGRGEILVELAGVIRLRRNPAPTREDLERALALLAKARKIGGPAKRIDAWEGETLMDLKRYGEALVRFQRGTLLNPNGYWSWLRCSQCLNALGRPKAALEYAIAALAIERDNGLTRRAVYELAQGLSGDGAVDGLTAAALIALSRVMDEPRLVPSDAAIRAARDPRSSDLVAYVRAQQGAFDPPTGDRPTAILARARSGDAAARDALPSAAARDPLVRHLGLLDPDLEELLR